MRIVVSTHTGQSSRRQDSLEIEERTRSMLTKIHSVSGITTAVNKAENDGNLRCFGRMTKSPIASASAEVVQSTSLVDMLRKICERIKWWLEQNGKRRPTTATFGQETHLVLRNISHYNVILYSEKPSGNRISSPLWRKRTSNALLAIQTDTLLRDFEYSNIP